MVRRMRGPTRFGADEAAAIQVVEAILVAVLVAGALIFFSLAQRPSFPADATARDESRVAADALALLQGDRPGNLATPNRDDLSYLLNQVFNDQPRATYRDMVDGVLPDGTLWRMSLYNGYGRVEILSSPGATVAHQASGAVAYAHNGLQVNSGGTDRQPLQAAPLSLPNGVTTCTVELNGEATAPSGRSWYEEWDAWLDARVGQVPRTTIPDFAPYGPWNYGGSCAPSAFNVLPSTGAGNGAFVYAVELVVWDAF